MNLKLSCFDKQTKKKINEHFFFNVKEEEIFYIVRMVNIEKNELQDVYIQKNVLLFGDDYYHEIRVLEEKWKKKLKQMKKNIQLSVRQNVLTTLHI